MTGKQKNIFLKDMKNKINAGALGVLFALSVNVLPLSGLLEYF
jgi:hypothetical protein